MNKDFAPGMGRARRAATGQRAAAAAKQRRRAAEADRDDPPGRRHAGMVQVGRSGLPDPHQPDPARAHGRRARPRRGVPTTAAQRGWPGAGRFKSKQSPSSGNPLRNSAAGRRLPPGFCSSVRRKRAFLAGHHDAMLRIGRQHLARQRRAVRRAALRAPQILIVTPLTCACAPGNGIEGAYLARRSPRRQAKSSAASSLLILAA